MRSNQFLNRSLAILLLGPVLWACGGEPAQREGFKRPPASVKTTPATMRPMLVSLEAIGTARANESVTISAKVTDTVSKVRFEDGELVSRGDVLVELTNEEEAALLAEAEANVKDARTQYERLADLLTQQSIPISQVDEASARLQAAIARQESIQARLQDRLVKAPFDGLLGFRNISQGSLLTATTAITTLDDISIIKLDFSIPELHLGKLRPGQEVFAMSEAFPNTDFPAKVQTIGSRVDPVTRAATVRALVPNNGGLLRPGMLMKVQVVLSRSDTLMIPETALQQRGSEFYVFTIEAGLAKRITIATGTRQSGWVQVISGLNKGDEIISDGVIKVRDNAPVKTINKITEPGTKPQSGSKRQQQTTGV